MKKVKEAVFNYLKKNGLKLTGQRRLILDAFIKAEGHLTAKEVYAMVKEKDSRIGYTTIYRTLKLLEEVGVARIINFGDRKRRYEHKYGHKHHDHLVCIRCGNSVGIFNEELKMIQDRLCEEKGFKPIYHELNIFGVCKKCRKQSNSL